MGLTPAVGFSGWLDRCALPINTLPINTLINVKRERQQYDDAQTAHSNCRWTDVQKNPKQDQKHPDKQNRYADCEVDSVRRRLQLRRNTFQLFACYSHYDNRYEDRNDP